MVPLTPGILSRRENQRWLATTTGDVHTIKLCGKLAQLTLFGLNQNSLSSSNFGFHCPIRLTLVFVIRNLSLSVLEG